MFSDSPCMIIMGGGGGGHSHRMLYTENPQSIIDLQLLLTGIVPCRSFNEVHGQWSRKRLLFTKKSDVQIGRNPSDMNTMQVRL